MQAQIISIHSMKSKADKYEGNGWKEVDNPGQTFHELVIFPNVKSELHIEENKKEIKLLQPIKEEGEEGDNVLRHVKEEDNKILHNVKNESHQTSFETPPECLTQDDVKVKNEITIEEHAVDQGDLSETESHHSDGRECLKPSKYQCGECGKSFTRRSYLGTHARTHTGEKPYVCMVCGRGFGQRIHLTKHERIHSGEKPFNCKECGKRFIRRGYLVKHLRTHTGERPYQCSQCSKNFSQRNHLTKHVRTHK